MAGQEETNIVEGWTKPIRYTLREAGAAIDLRNDSGPLTLSVRTKDDQVITFGGAVTVDDPLGAGFGQITVSPLATDFRNADSPYAVRVKRTDSDGNVAYYPDATPIKFNVAKP